jgi:hypothetical protein
VVGAIATVTVTTWPSGTVTWSVMTTVPAS